MKSAIENLEGLKRKITIEVPQEVVDSTFETVYKSIQKTASVKGFRKGKIPLTQVKSLYKAKAYKEALDRLVDQSYREALTEHDLEPLEQPHIHIGSFEEQKAFSYTAELEVRPTVEVKTYEGLDVKKEDVNLAPEKVEEVLNHIQERFQELQPVFEERAAEQGDVAEIDFDGTLEGKPLPGGQANNHQLELGSNSFIPGFEEAIIGMKPGSEKTIALKFPKDYHAKEIANKDVSFEVKLHKLQKKVLPELNDELAQKVSDKFKTLEELKNTIRDDLLKDEELRIQSELKKNILKELVAKNPVEVPETLHKDQVQKMREDTAQRLKQQGMDNKGIEDYHKKWESDYKDSASFMIQASFLVDTLANKLSFSAEEKDFEAKLLEDSIKMGLPVEELKTYYSKPEVRNNLRYQIVEDKVVQHLIDKANLTSD